MAVNIQYPLHTMLATPDLPPENQVIPKNPHPPPPGVNNDWSFIQYSSSWL